jgi:hypothetical protein
LETAIEIFANENKTTAYLLICSSFIEKVISKIILKILSLFENQIKTSPEGKSMSFM